MGEEGTVARVEEWSFRTAWRRSYLGLRGKDALGRWGRFGESEGQLQAFQNVWAVGDPRDQ